MPINKEKNSNLQITISKSDVVKLETIREQLSALLDVELTKSQAVSFLIKNYGKNALNVVNDVFKEQRPRTAQNSAKLGTPRNSINYSALVKALKDKLNVSYPRLSQIVGIPAPTLKKYARGIQYPKDENEQLLNIALKNYGIK